MSLAGNPTAFIRICGLLSPFTPKCFNRKKDKGTLALPGSPCPTSEEEMLDEWSLRSPAPAPCRQTHDTHAQEKEARGLRNPGDIDGDDPNHARVEALVRARRGRAVIGIGLHRDFRRSVRAATDEPVSRRGGERIGMAIAVAVRARVGMNVVSIARGDLESGRGSICRVVRGLIVGSPRGVSVIVCQNVVAAANDDAIDADGRGAATTASGETPLTGVEVEPVRTAGLREDQAAAGGQVDAAAKVPDFIAAGPSGIAPRGATDSDGDAGDRDRLAHRRSDHERRANDQRCDRYKESDSTSHFHLPFLA
jgi:hypothetical protein